MSPTEETADLKTAIQHRLRSNGEEIVDLKTAIQQHLRSNGVIDEITAQVRSNLLLSIRNKMKPKQNPGLEDMAWLSLVYHFLGEKNFAHTLSVFTAECGLESSQIQVLTLFDALKALGFGRFLDENQILSKDQYDGKVSILLTTISKWSSSHGASTTLTRAVQTDTDLHIDNKENKQPSKSLDQRLQEMERDLRHEMNEKLRLSAKKQAINATRRVEEKYQDEIASLKKQIQFERGKTKQIEEDCMSKIASEKLSIEKERIDWNKKYDRLLLEKETLESDVGLMVEYKKKENREMTAKHDELDEQKRRLQSKINEILLQQEAMKATEIMCEALQGEKDSWLAQRKELLDEIELLRQNLASVHKAKDLTYQSCGQLKAEQVKLVQEHRIKENELQKENAQLECHCEKLNDKYQATLLHLEKTRLQLDTTKSEVASLRSLLRQSTSALQSVTFRDEESPKRHLSNAHRTPLPLAVFRSARANLPSTPAAQSTSRKELPCHDTRDCPPTKYVEKQQDEDSEADADANKNVMGTKADWGHLSDDSCLPSSSKDPPMLSPKDPPCGRSFASETICDSPGNHVSALFHSNNVDCKSQTLVESAIIHHHADDVSAISEGMSGKDIQTDIQMSKPEIKPDESKTHSCSTQKGESSVESNSGLSQKIRDDATDESIVGPLSASIHRSCDGKDSINATLYSESFHSENTEADNFVSQESNEIKDILQNDVETPDTPTSAISCTSSEGYSASFCTEE